jgi:SAM-dependent methyltransferase
MSADSTSRSPERIRHHYEVEKELATRLRASTREERTELFKTLYTELFDRVPDHPRLTRRDTTESSQQNSEKQLRLLRPHFPETGPKPVLVEFAPGDCRLSFAAAPACEKVYGIDISDQRSPGEVFPENFDLIVYDGYHLDLPDGCADIAFSYQFLEHLHPDDVDSHFEMVHRLLKPGGVYVFDTPHRYSGPHDISREFGDTLECFHFQEWSYREMRRLLKHHGFGRTAMHRKGRLVSNRPLNVLHDGIEWLAGALPSQLRRRTSNRLFPSVTLSAWRNVP